MSIVYIIQFSTIEILWHGCEKRLDYKNTSLLLYRAEYTQESVYYFQREYTFGSHTYTFIPKKIT